MSIQPGKQKLRSIIKHNKYPIIFVVLLFSLGIFPEKNYFGEIGAIIVVIGIISGFFGFGNNKFLKLIEELGRPDEIEDRISSENIEHGKAPYDDENESDRQRANEIRANLGNKADYIRRLEKSKTEFTCNILIVCFGTIVNGFNSWIHGFILFLRQFVGNY